MPEAKKEAQRLPFRIGTRQHIDILTTRSITIDSTHSNQQLEPIRIPKVGMAAGIFVALDCTVAVGAAAALADRGPWNALKRLTVKVNGSSLVLYDLDGYGAFLVDCYLQKGFRPDREAWQSDANDTAIYATPLAQNATATWKMIFYIPLHSNDELNFEVGLVNLQATQLEMQLVLTTGSLADIGTNITSFTATATVSYLFYEIPNPGKFMLPPPNVVRRIQSEIPINGTGEHIFEINRGGMLVDLKAIYLMNAVRSDAIDRFEFRLNRQDYAYRIQRDVMRWRQRIYSGVDYPVGVYQWPLYAASGLVHGGDLRDAWNTSQVTTMEAITQISSSASLGSNNNKVVLIETNIQNLAG